MLEWFANLSEESIVAIITTVTMGLISIATCVSTLIATQNRFKKDLHMQILKERMEAYAEFMDAATDYIFKSSSADEPTHDAMFTRANAALYRAMLIAPMKTRTQMLQLQAQMYNISAGDQQVDASNLLTQTIASLTMEIDSEMGASASGKKESRRKRRKP